MNISGDNMPVIGHWSGYSKANLTEKRRAEQLKCDGKIHALNCGNPICLGILVCGCRPRRKHRWTCHTSKTWKQYFSVLLTDWNGGLQIRNGYLNRHLFFRFHLLGTAFGYKWTWTKDVFDVYVIMSVKKWRSKSD